MIKQYSSFSQIDKCLEILNLQREIYKESFKLDLNRAKIDIAPTQILDGFSGSLQKTVLTFAIKKLKSIF